MFMGTRRALNPGISARPLFNDLILSPAPPPPLPDWLVQLLASLLGGGGQHAATAAADSAGRHADLHPNNTGGGKTTHSTCTRACTRTHTACTHACRHTPPQSLSQSQCIRLVFHLGACSMLMQSRSSYLPLCPADGRVRPTRRKRRK